MLKLSQYYAHPMMKDKHLNICQDCVRTTNRERYRAKIRTKNTHGNI